MCQYISTISPWDNTLITSQFFLNLKQLKFCPKLFFSTMVRFVDGGYYINKDEGCAWIHFYPKEKGKHKENHHIMNVWCLFLQLLILHICHNSIYRYTWVTGREPLTYYDMNLSAQDHQTFFTCDTDHLRPADASKNFTKLIWICSKL